MNCLFAAALGLALAGSASAAAWDESAAGYGSDPYAASATSAASDASYAPMYGDGSNDYESGLSVDPIYSTPNTYESRAASSPRFAPYDVYFEYLGNMSLSSQPAHLQVVNAVVTIPFVNPSRVSFYGWHLDVRATARITWVDVSGRDVLDEDDLYTVGLHASLAHSIGASSQFQVGFTPQISSDFDVMTHDDFFWGGYVAFSAKAGEDLRYTVGVACMPDYYSHYVLPVVSLSWRYAPSWELRVQASRVSAVCVASETFQWGPFMQWNSGIWTVHRYGQTQQFRMTNCIAGVGATYDFHLASGASVSLLGDLGMTFYNTFRIRDRRGDHTLERYRAHPGLYARVGAQFSF